MWAPLMAFGHMGPRGWPWDHLCRDVEGAEIHGAGVRVGTEGPVRCRMEAG